MTCRYQQLFGNELQPHDRYPRNRLEYYLFKYLLARGDFRVADLIAFPRFEDILEQGLPTSEVTLAEVLRRQGYRTAIIGKWHLGSYGDHIPIRRGFDYHYGFYEAHTLYADPADPDIVNRRYDDFTDRHIWSQGLRGGKFTNFEGGINVPFLVRWRGMVPAGAPCTHPVSALDVFATAVDAAGAELPSDRPYDGVSLLPYLTGRTTAPPHEALFWRAEYHKAIRKGDWKLVKDEMSGRTVLYDLATDEGERRNLAPAQPEVLRALEQALPRWANEQVSPLWPRVMDFRFVDGEEVYFFPL